MALMVQVMRQANEFLLTIVSLSAWPKVGTTYTRGIDDWREFHRNSPGL